MKVKDLLTKKEIEKYKRNTCRTDRKYMQGFKEGFEYALKVIDEKLQENNYNTTDNILLQDGDKITNKYGDQFEVTDGIFTQTTHRM